MSLVVLCVVELFLIIAAGAEGPKFGCDFNINNLRHAVQDVSDWQILGSELGVPWSKLDSLKRDPTLSYDSRKTEMLLAWLNDDVDASWEKLSDALDQMNQGRLAAVIRAQCVTKSTSDADTKERDIPSTDHGTTAREAPSMFSSPPALAGTVDVPPTDHGTTDEEAVGVFSSPPLWAGTVVLITTMYLVYMYFRPHRRDNGALRNIRTQLRLKQPGTHTEPKQGGGTDQTDYGNGATPHDQRDPNGTHADQRDPNDEDDQVPPALEACDFPLLADVNVKERDGVTTNRLLDCVEVLLMVVNVNELRAVLGLMKPISGTFVKAIRDSTTFTIGMYGQFPAAVVRTSPGGLGFDGAEQKTMRAIEVVKPSLVVSVGVAYGKGGDQKLSDVIVCTVVNDYTYKRLGEKKVLCRSSQPPVSPRLLNVFKNPMGWKKERAPNDSCAVILGPLVCGPDLVDDLKEKEKRFEVFGDAKGGEMESAAILSAIDAAKDHKTVGIIIKAITDWGDGNKHKKWQPFAAHTAAHYVLHHLKQEEAYKDLARKKDKFPSEVRQ